MPTLLPMTDHLVESLVRITKQYLDTTIFYLYTEENREENGGIF